MLNCKFYGYLLVSTKTVWILHPHPTCWNQNYLRNLKILMSRFHSKILTCSQGLKLRIIELNTQMSMWNYLLYISTILSHHLFFAETLKYISSIQSLSHVQLLMTPWTAARQAYLSITNLWSPPQPMSIESVMPSNHLILCCPLLLPSIFPMISVFSNESALHIRWPKDWSFSLSIRPSSEHPELISIGMDRLDLLAVQGTLKSLLQHHTSKASILLSSGFFIVQLSHPYMTTGKTIALTRWTFVDKVMFLLFNMLSRLVITFLPRSKHLLISWLQSPSAVIFEPPKIKSATVSTVFPSISHEVMGPDAMILLFWMLSFKPTSSFSSFTFIKRLFSSSLVSAIRVVSSAYLRLLIFLPAILIPACASSSPAFLMMYSHHVHFSWCILSTGWQYTALTYSFSYLEPVCCPMSSFNWCFLTCIHRIVYLDKFSEGSPPTHTSLNLFLLLLSCFFLVLGGLTM